MRENRADADTISQFLAEDYTLVVVLYCVTRDDLKGSSLTGRMRCTLWKSNLTFRTNAPHCLTEPSVESLNINTGLISLGEEKEAEL